jgi:hypothetical protein
MAAQGLSSLAYAVTTTVAPGYGGDGGTIRRMTALSLAAKRPTRSSFLSRFRIGMVRTFTGTNTSTPS